MPLRHVVLLELQPATPPEVVEQIAAALRSLPAAIEAIRTYEVSVDLGLQHGNATLAVVAGFDDADGWRSYGPHPAHQDVVQRLIAPHVVRRLALQAEVPTL